MTKLGRVIKFLRRAGGKECRTIYYRLKLSTSYIVKLEYVQINLFISEFTNPIFIFILYTLRCYRSYKFIQNTSKVYTN